MRTVGNQPPTNGGHVKGMEGVGGGGILQWWKMLMFR